MPIQVPPPGNRPAAAAGTPRSTPARPPSLATLARPTDVKPRPSTPTVAKPANIPAPPSTPQQRPSSTVQTGPSVHQRLEKLFNGEHHWLETGTSNRLALSLLSGIPEDVDFALDHLLTLSFHEVDLLPFDKFPGLLEGLLAQLRGWIEFNATSGSPYSVYFADARRRAARRRALESALVMRNLATVEANRKALKANPRMLPTVIEALELEIASQTESAEMAIYLSEFVETISPIIEMAPTPVPPLSKELDGEVDGKVWTSQLQEADVARSWGSRLYQALSRFTQSNDRAVMLAAYRALSALGMGQLNRAFLGAMSHSSHTLSPPICRGIELLPLPDVDLLLPILDFLYTATADPIVAACICIRPDFRQLLRLLVAHSRHRLAQIPQAPTVLKWPSADWRWTSRAAKELTKAKEEPRAASASQNGASAANGATPAARLPFDQAATVLSDSDLAEIVNIPEPRRTMVWMRYVFEPEADAEVQQVELWMAYKNQFEGRGPAIIAAQEVIKMSTDAFPDAMPMVTDRLGQKMFVIRGMKIRIRGDLNSFYGCKWQGCGERSFPSAGDLYDHLLTTHLAPAPSPGACRWLSCSFGHRNEPVTPGDLTYHVRTHVPIHSGPRVPRPPPGKDASLPAINRVVKHKWTVPSGGADAGAVGIGYLALLVTRNLARCVAGAVCDPTTAEKGRRTGAARQDESDDRREAREFGIFGRLVEAEKRAALARGEAVNREEDKEEELGPDPAVAAPEVMALEGEMLRWAERDAGLVEVAAEVLAHIDAMGRALEEKDTVRDPDGDVQMGS